jgi:peptidoglycan hydrolase-like protein with peptidoglycan-binding domain
MQILLIGYGYSCGPDGADGDFGKNTEKAVRAYQKATGKVVDGTAGPETLGSLYGLK